ncbi:MAG: F0F1 ATP synthase subunit B family protein [Polyangiales bacterium]
MALSSVQTGALAELSSQASGGVVVDLDLTFVGQLVLFFLLFLLPKPMLFEPMIKLFEEREKRTGGAKDDAKKLYADADAKMAKYEEEVLLVKQKAGAERDRIRAEGQKKEQAILATVRDETNKVVEEGRARIAKEREALKGELGTVSQQLAREIASRVLGREVQP